MIDNRLNKWINDSITFDMEKEYGVEYEQTYAFNDRQDDFYITLLNQFFDIINNKDISEHKRDLRKIAQGLAVYSRIKTKGYFSGVEANRNMVYVCTALYLSDYSAISSLLSKQINIEGSFNEYQSKIIYLISGGKIRLEGYEVVDEYVISGNPNILDKEIEKTNSAIESNSFEDADNFFDGYVYRAVLLKFAEHNLWRDLIANDSSIDWGDYVKLSSKQHILTFLPSQLDAIEKGLLTFDKSFSLKMPTSAGKSYITQLIIYQELQRNHSAKILYIAPLRALSHEVSENYHRISKTLKFSVIARYGGFVEANLSDIEERDMLITTPETLIALEGALDDFLTPYTLIICDEGQLLDSLERGINYELLLSRLRKMPNKRFLFISAIIPNIADVNEWLGGDKEQVGESSYRPCKIRFGEAVESDQGALNIYFYDCKYDYVISEVSFIQAKDFEVKESTSKKSKSCALALQSLNAGSVLIYTQEKGGNVGTSSFAKTVIELIGKTNLPKPLSFSKQTDKAIPLQLIQEYVAYLFGENHVQSQALAHGFAFHNGDLPQNIREMFESAFSNGTIPLIVSNSTLAEGVNLPIKTIVLGSILEMGINGRRVPVDEFRLKNIVGRAGRAGKEEFGTVLMLKDSYTESNVLKALKGDSEKEIKGTLYDLIEALSNYNWDTDDESLMRGLEDVGLAWAIDLMLERSTDEENTLDSIDVHEIVSNTLAYSLGDDDIKARLIKLFALRLKEIKSRIKDEDYHSFYQTGMDLNFYEGSEELIQTVGIDFFSHPYIYNHDWIVNFISKLLSIKAIHDCFPDKYKYFSQFPEMVWLWIKGQQYYQIAESLKIKDVDRILQSITLATQGQFSAKLKTFVRFLTEKYNVEEDEYKMLLDFIKYGIDSIEKDILRSEFQFKDRITINYIVDYLNKIERLDDVFDGEHYDDRRLETYIIPSLEETSIPKLCKTEIRDWLKS